MLCPKCKKEITAGVQFCPECGTDVTKKKKPITKKWWFWVIIAVVLIAIISTASGSGNSNSDISADTGVEQNIDASADTTTKAPESTTVKTVFNVGESVTDGILKITYVSAEEWTGYDQYTKPADGNKIVKVVFNFVNEGTSDTFINSFYCYADNQAASDYIYVDDYFSVFTLSAGRSTSGSFYFEVSENAEEIEVEYEVNAWTDKKAIFNVEL